MIDLFLRIEGTVLSLIPMTLSTTRPISANIQSKLRKTKSRPAKSTVYTKKIHLQIALSLC